MSNELIVSEKDHNQTLHRWLRKQFPNITFSQWQKWFRTGQVRCNGKRVKGSEHLARGQTIRIPPQATLINRQAEDNRCQRGRLTYPPSRKEAEAFPSMIVYENETMLVLNKPAGLAVQGGSGITHHVDGLVRALYGDDAPKLVHRIDKETSGLLILAKTHQMAQKLTKAFAEHTIQKRYLAVVEGIPPRDKGTIVTPIEKGVGRNIEKMLTTQRTSQAKTSKTAYVVLSKTIKHNTALLALTPHTGRTHQLRVHCEHIGCPILGDKKYNEKTRNRHLHLHAYELHLPKALGDKMFAAPVPDYFALTLERYELTPHSS